MEGHGAALLGQLQPPCVSHTPLSWSLGPGHPSLVLYRRLETFAGVTANDKRPPGQASCLGLTSASSAPRPASEPTPAGPLDPTGFPRHAGFPAFIHRHSLTIAVCASVLGGQGPVPSPLPSGTLAVASLPALASSPLRSEAALQPCLRVISAWPWSLLEGDRPPSQPCDGGGRRGGVISWGCSHLLLSVDSSPWQE